MPDDQGPLGTCTRHGLGKGICNGLDAGKWTGGNKVDVIQEEVVEKIKMIHNDDTHGKFPWDFDGKTIEIYAENPKEILKVELYVKRLQNKEDIDMNLYEYVLVYKYSANEDHCVYIVSYDANKQVFWCMNSQGTLEAAFEKKLSDVKYVSRLSCLVKEDSSKNRFKSSGSFSDRNWSPKSKKIKRTSKERRTHLRTYPPSKKD